MEVFHLSVAAGGGAELCCLVVSSKVREGEAHTDMERVRKRETNRQTDTEIERETDSQRATLQNT